MIVVLETTNELLFIRGDNISPPQRYLEHMCNNLGQDHIYFS